MVRGLSSSRTLEAPQSFFKVMVGDFFDKMLIPPAYAEKIEGILPQKITLTTRDGRREKVIMSEIKNKLCFKAGWSDFVKDKSINLGDFLVFHNVDEFEFKVTIYRSETGCEDMLLVSENDINVIDIDSDDSTTDMEIDKFERKRAKVPKAMQQRERAAEKFVSKHPFFKVTMTHAYVNASYLYVPASFVKEYVTRQSQNVMLLTSKKSSWTVKLDITGNCRCRMTSGWNEFVRDNNLHKGDVCVFQMIKRFEVVFKVSIVRSTR